MIAKKAVTTLFAGASLLNHWTHLGANGVKLGASSSGATSSAGKCLVMCCGPSKTFPYEENPRTFNAYANAMRKKKQDEGVVPGEQLSLGFFSDSYEAYMKYYLPGPFKVVISQLNGEIVLFTQNGGAGPELEADWTTTVEDLKESIEAATQIPFALQDLFIVKENGVNHHLNMDSELIGSAIWKTLEGKASNVNTIQILLRQRETLEPLGQESLEVGEHEYESTVAKSCNGSASQRSVLNAIWGLDIVGNCLYEEFCTDLRPDPMHQWRLEEIEKRDKIRDEALQQARYERQVRNLDRQTLGQEWIKAREPMFSSSSSGAREDIQSSRFKMRL